MKMISEKKVTISLKETSSPIVHNSVTNTYTKGDLFCVMIYELGELKVVKYPIGNIFRIIEDDILNEKELTI
jgi:hypothetical protein